MAEPNKPTAMSLDTIEHFFEARLLREARQLGREIWLERLAAPLRSPLKRSGDQLKGGLDRLEVPAAGALKTRPGFVSMAA